MAEKKFQIRRQFFTNIQLVHEINSLKWEGLDISVKADPVYFIDAELILSGAGDWKDYLYGDKIEKKLRLMDLISYYYQSHVEIGHNIAVYEEGQGEERIFSYFVHEPREGTGMATNPSNIKGLGDTLGHDIDDSMKDALRWLRRSLISSYGYEGLFFVLLAIESLTESVEGFGVCKKGCKLDKCAGDHEVLKHRKTNHNQIKEIIGEELHKKVYRGNIRNDLFHGARVDEQVCIDCLQQLYKKLVEYLGRQGLPPLRILKNPRKKVGYAQGRLKMRFITKFPTQGIPSDVPSIFTLIRGWENKFTNDNDQMISIVNQ